MNKLDAKTRCTILLMLCEGSSIRSIARVTGTSKNTVSKLLVEAGRACMKFHDEAVRDVNAHRIQCDEIWSFCYAKQKNVETAKDAPEGAGDVWTWTALDADSKLIVSYLVADRSGEAAIDLMDDLRARLANRVQLTTDGHKAYLEALEGAFGGDVDYAQLVKLCGSIGGKSAEDRYGPAESTGIRKRTVEGNLDEARVSTSHVERSNLTMRMHMRLFTRPSNAFSKKIENHAYAVALHMVYYNFVRSLKTLHMSPAMVVGVSDRLWDIADIVKLVEKAEADKPTKRGPYYKISN